MDGWIKLHRKIRQSDMYRSLNSKQRDVLITLLLMANHQESQWEYKDEFYKVKPGQLVTSLDTIQQNCASDVSIQNVRTALLKLEKWGFLTNQSTKKNRLITIVNWGFYQGSHDEINKDSNSQLTNNQQSTNSQLTTNKNVKNDKNEKKDNDDFWSGLNSKSSWQEKTPEQKYYDEIESYFRAQAKYNKPYLISNDLKLLEQFWMQKIPIDRIKAAIDNSVEFLGNKGETLNSLGYVATIIEKAQNKQNRVVPFRPSKSSSSKPNKIPKAVLKQMEQAQNGSSQTKIDEQELAARQAIIQEKLRRMNELLSAKKVAKRRGNDESISDS